MAKCYPINTNRHRKKAVRREGTDVVSKKGRRIRKENYQTRGVKKYKYRVYMVVVVGK